MPEQSYPNGRHSKNSLFIWFLLLIDIWRPFPFERFMNAFDMSERNNNSELRSCILQLSNRHTNIVCVCVLNHNDNKLEINNFHFIYFFLFVYLFIMEDGGWTKLIALIVAHTLIQTRNGLSSRGKAKKGLPSHQPHGLSLIYLPSTPDIFHSKYNLFHI